MELDNYSLEDLFLFGMKSEIVSKEQYMSLAKSIDDRFLKDKLNYLATEEEKHRATLEEMYKIYFSGKEIILPDDTIVPITEIIPKSDISLREILDKAIRAEGVAQIFYFTMSNKLSEDKEASATLLYFAAMEGNHIELLKTEKNKIFIGKEE